NTPFRTFELTNFAAQNFDLERWLGQADAIAVSQHFATTHRLKRGDTLRAQVNGSERNLHIGFVLTPRDAREWDEHLAAMDIGWAQELFSMRGRLSSIELQIDDPGTVHRNQLINRLRARLPANVEIAAPAQRSEQIDKMLSGFRLNLTAMSLVS